MKRTIIFLGGLLLAGVAQAQTPETVTQPEIDFSIMDEKCRTDPALEGRCFTLPVSYASSITLWEYAVSKAAPHGGDPELMMNHIIELNNWHGATGDLVIPAGVAFRGA